MLNKGQIIERCIHRILEEYGEDPRNLLNITRQDSIILIWDIRDGSFCPKCKGNGTERTVPGVPSETQNILQRMKELATQAASDTNVGQDRGEMQKELNQLTSEINRIGNTTEFNTQKLLNGGTGTTAQIRYSVATAGVAQVAAEGAVSAVTQINDSTKASSATVTDVDELAKSVVGAAAVGDLSAPATVTPSVAAGTGEIDNFSVDIASVKAASSGSVADSFKVVQASVAGGTGAISDVSELAVGASNEGRLAGFNEATKSVAAGTGEIQKTEIVGGALGTITAVGAVAAGPSTVDITVTANFGEGNTITIGGEIFTAVAENGGTDNTATTFEVAANLTAAINENTTISGAGAAQWTAGTAGSVITLTSTDNAETVLGTATVADAKNMETSGEITAVVGTNAATYGIEIKSNFTAGDTIDIGGTTFEAGVDFAIGDTIDATRDNLLTTLKATGGGADQAVLGLQTYDLTDNDPFYAAGGYDDNNLIVLTQTVAGADANAVDMNASAVTKVVNQKGVYEFEVATNYETGQEIEINGYTFTAGNTTDASTATTFKIGADVSATAGFIQDAIDAAKVNADGVAGGNTDGALLLLTTTHHLVLQGSTPIPLH